MDLRLGGGEKTSGIEQLSRKLLIHREMRQEDLRNCQKQAPELAVSFPVVERGKDNHYMIAFTQ